MKSDESMDKKGVSRRKVLAGAGALAAGAALTQFGGLLRSAEAKKTAAGNWPWPYEKLDPAKTAEIAYDEWYRVFCGAAVINSVFKQLSKKIGDPYKSLPADAFVFLEGGQVGWGERYAGRRSAQISWLTLLSDPGLPALMRGI